LGRFSPEAKDTALWFFPQNESFSPGGPDFLHSSGVLDNQLGDVSGGGKNNLPGAGCQAACQGKFSERIGLTPMASPKKLLHCHAFSQIPGLIYVTAAQNRHVIRQKL
jgi:hypothetical protein